MGVVTATPSGKAGNNLTVGPDVSWLPDALSSFVLALILTAITVVSGWVARHTPRNTGGW